MPFTVRVNDFESIEREWEEILPGTKANTIFVTPWWQKIWWRHFGDGAELLILSVRDGDELRNASRAARSSGPRSAESVAGSISSRAKSIAVS